MRSETGATDPIRVSWSMLRAHEECKQKTSLLRSGKRAKAQDLRLFFHGMVVDNVMRDWLAHPDRANIDMRDLVESRIERGQQEAIDSGDGVVRWRHANDRDDLRAFAVELVRRLQPILDERVLPYEYYCGYRFKHPLTLPDGTDIVLNGEMDLLVADHGWAVWDLKGTKDNGYWRKVVGQLAFYDIATKIDRGEHPRLTGLIQPMCDEPLLTFQFDAEARRIMFARILRYVEDVKAANEQCRADTSGCSWCEVKHACPRYTPTPGTNTLSLSAGLRQAAQETQT